MRENKFRGWNKKEKFMSEVFVFGYEGYTIDDDGVHYINEKRNTVITSFSLKGDYILMQYTGLKDKNGEEIYEGDIVKSVSELVKMMSDEKTGKYRTEIYSIIYVENEARFATKDPKRDKYEPFALSQDRMTEYYEVIGNIYENPELRTVEK